MRRDFLVLLLCLVLPALGTAAEGKGIVEEGIAAEEGKEGETVLPALGTAAAGKTVLPVLGTAAAAEGKGIAAAEEGSGDDGPYRNPIIYADVPDMSVCRVDSVYYMVSTTMHLMPGAPIMRSRDLRSWETIGYVFPHLDDGPRYFLLDGTAYGQGQWASSLRYHDGRFYVWFTANGAPHRGFLYCADDPAGPWSLVARPPHFHDASLFFDDDGRVYLFHGTGHLTELRADLQDVKVGGVDCQLFERDADEQGLLEGSAVVKHDGRYYLLMISMDWSVEGRLRREVCYRADSICGPYEKRVILETAFDDYGGVGQGCIVDSPSGEWYGMLFQDRGAIGRVPCLMPCTWTADGWPLLGDAEGQLPSSSSVPYSSLSGICGSDTFEGDTLSLYWQWNHHPIDSAWCLREGALHLTVARCADNLYVAPNTLTQRMVGPHCAGTAQFNVAGMKDGDRAGLAAFNSDSGVLTIAKDDGHLFLVASAQRSIFREPGHSVEGVATEELARVPLSQEVVWLRVAGDFGHDSDVATFAYSLDGTTWQPLAGSAPLTFDYRRLFMGTRFALFNYGTHEVGGTVAVEAFSYDFP